MNINMPSDVEMIIDKLIDNGYDAYAVGGCIRDSIIGKTPNDWDICTSALPEETKKVFNEYKIIDTGIKHGTISLLLNDVIYEITTFRIDGNYKDNRHPQNVTFVNAIKEDLARRDFTINALAYNKYKGVIDYFGGLDDIKKHIIRCVGSADKRFNEDALRILRAIRFSAVYNFSIEENTSYSIHKNAHLISNISYERINAEINKILLSKNPSKILMNYSDVISVFIPEIKKCIGFNQNTKHHCYTVWEHIVRTVDNVKPKLVLRLSMIFHDIAKPICATEDENGNYHFIYHDCMGAEIAKDILTRLKYPNIIIKDCVELIKVHDMQLPSSYKKVKKLLCKYNSEFLYNLIDIKMADISAQSDYMKEDKKNSINLFKNLLDKAINEEDCVSLKDMKINGRDIINLGVSEGKIIGNILTQLLDMIIDNKLKNDYTELINKAKEIISDIRGDEKVEDSFDSNKC